MADLAKLVDDLSSLTVLEAPRREVGRLRRRCRRRCRPGRRPGRRRRGADRVHGSPDRRWRQEDRGHQGGPRDHRPRPQGSQGPRRGRSEGRQGVRQQGRGREAQGPAREGWRQDRAQVRLLDGPFRPITLRPVRLGLTAPTARGFTPVGHGRFRAARPAHARATGFSVREGVVRRGGPEAWSREADAFPGHPVRGT
jgi:hypothetical protein